MWLRKAWAYCAHALACPFWYFLTGSFRCLCRDISNEARSFYAAGRCVAVCVGGWRSFVPSGPIDRRKGVAGRRTTESKNATLQNAKNKKYDEFFTTYEDVESELSHYVKHFAGKTVLCNCDDPFTSNFCLFFLRHFNVLKLRRLICTSCRVAHAVPIGTARVAHFPLCGLVLDTKPFCSGDTVVPLAVVAKFLAKPDTVRTLKGDGDFRSEECKDYLRQADIVVTNPPFSLFKELFTMLVKGKKKFLLVGNQNALTYKEIFPFIQGNKVWTGYQFGDMKFRVPADSEPRKTRCWIDEQGQKWRSLGNAMWLTNLDIERRHKKMVLTKHYTPEEFPFYDSYDAINVRRITDIPYDFAGIMGVPITIINRYNCEQFELVGEANHGSDNEHDLFKPTLKGKLLFKRILIRNRQVQQ